MIKTLEFKPGTLPQVLFQLRKQSGLTQEQVARSIGVTVSTISHYERKRRGIPLHHAEQMAALYGYETKTRLEIITRA